MNEASPLVTQPVRETIEAPGRGSFSVLRWGDDASKPLLVYCHATGFNAQTYTSLLTPLTDQFRIIAIDQRGHGFSEADNNPDVLTGWDTYADDLVAILDVLGEPVCLSGHSMGSTVSMIAAAKRPALVKAMLLVEPVMMPPIFALIAMVRKLIGKRLTSPLVEGAARRRAEFPDREMMFKSYKGRGAFKTWPDHYIRNYVEGGSIVVSPEKTVLACAPAWESKTFTMGSSNVWGRAGKVKCPVKVLYAETNSTMRPQSEKIVRRKQPNWDIEQVPGSSHFLPMEFTELVQQNLRELLKLQ